MKNALKSSLRNSMKKLTQAVPLCLLAAVPGAARAQSAQSPADTVQSVPMPGFRLPTVGGNLTYAMNASQSVSTGLYANGDPTASSNFSGDLAYLSPSRRYPFSAVYSGALLAGTNGQPFQTVQNLALSQVFVHREWNLVVTDAVSYLPQSATVGLSGVAGLGDMGIDPVESGPTTGQAALTGYAPRVDNATTVSIDHKLGSRMSLQGSGSFVMQRFTDDSPGLIDSNQAVGSLGATRSLDARSSINTNYTLSKITYSPDTFSSAFNVQSLNFGYSRQWTRSFSLDASLGPQWISTHLGGSTHTSTELTTDIAAHYTNRLTSGSVSYVRGTNNGFGVIPGGFSDSINSTLHHTILRVWNTSATLNYTRTSDPAALGLPSFSLHTLVGGLQVSKSINRSLSGFASYNAQHQSTSGIADTSSAFQGLYQVVSVGITYAPRTVSLGRQ